MADWTIGAGSNPQHYRSRGGASTPVIRYFQESTAASTAVIKAGDVVQNDTVVSTGGFRIVRAVCGGGTPAVVLNTTNVLGIALEGSTSDGSTTGLTLNGQNQIGNRMIGVCIAENDAEFKGYLDAGASFSSMVGTAHNLRYDSTNHVYLVESTNSTASLTSVFITDIPLETVGDTNGPVIFKFLAANVSPAVK
jgi:hypothetical protein